MTEKLFQNKSEIKDNDQEAAEVLAERLRLKEQYLSQIKVLYESGVLENFAVNPEQGRYAPEMGVIGIDGKDYPLPSYEDILSRLQDPEKRALMEKKAEQGFTKLQLVPLALPLSVLIDRFKHTLLKIHKETGVKATDGSTLELDENNPLHVWEDILQCDNPETPQGKQMEYGVTNYEGETKEARGGRYKSELLQNPDNAWRISLIEDCPDLPAEGKGKTVSGRKQFEANQSPEEYLKLLQTQEPCQGEAGQTPEEALTAWLTYLQEKHVAIDDWEGQGKANWLAGQYLSGYVPGFYWDRGARRPVLDRNYPGDRYSYDGFRPAARF
ncbi:MAG: hypothetical protein AAB791_02305 [Patescibacteria group bacterium]